MGTRRSPSMTGFPVGSGRCTRAIYEQGLSLSASLSLQEWTRVVAINASGDLATNAHLLKYDPHRFRTSGPETEGENVIIIDLGDSPSIDPGPGGVRWATHGVDLLLSMYSDFTTKAKASALLEQGAKRVLISAPGGDDVIYHHRHGRGFRGALKASHRCPNASCTTNCLAPVADPGRTSASSQPDHPAAIR